MVNGFPEKTRGLTYAPGWSGRINPNKDKPRSGSRKEVTFKYCRVYTETQNNVCVDSVLAPSYNMYS